MVKEMKASGMFSETNLLHVQETRGAGGEHTFSIAFTYSGNR